MNLPASELRVLHVVWNLIRGGTEGQCARVAVELARRGLRQRIAVFRREGYFLEQVESVCGPVFDVGIRRMFNLETLGRVRALAEFIRAEHFDLVHAWDADAAIFGQFAAARAGVPLITSRRDLGQIYPPHKLWLMRRADRRAAAVVVNAEGIRAMVRAQGIAAEKIVRVSNVLDAEESDQRAAQPVPVPLPAGPLVGMVARLDPEKDGGTFVRAAALVARGRPDVSFVIAGDGPERAALEALAAQLGIRDRVIFLGDITYVPALASRLAIGALVPKANEGLSNTILEYMAARLPVIATDCGGNRELVENGVTGCLVAAGDHAAVGRSMIQLLEDAPRCTAMGLEGRKRLERDHGPDAVADRFQELYQRVADSGPA